MIEIIQPTQIITKRKGETLAVNIPKELLSNWEHDHNFFLDLKELKKKKIKKLDLQGLWHKADVRRYFYAEGDIANLIQLLEQRDRIMQDALYEEWERVSRNDVIEEISKKTFDPSKLHFLDTSCYLVYSYRADYPTSRPYRISYVGGIDNSEFDLKTAKKILKSNPWVSAIEEIKIPYYNAYDGRSHAIEYTVQLPQEDYENLITFLRDKKKEEFWSVKLKDILGNGCSYFEGVDPLGLRPALLNDEH